MIQQNVYFSIDSKQIVYYNVSVNKMFTQNKIKGTQKMRKFLSSVLALLMLISTFSCLTVTGFAADTALTEKESNDIEKTPNEIKVGSVNIGALQSCEDVDWYKFVCEKEKNDYFTISFNLNDITDKNYIGNAWDVSIYDNEYNLIRL